jgi:hypothetical protein
MPCGARGVRAQRKQAARLVTFARGFARFPVLDVVVLGAAG